MILIVEDDALICHMAEMMLQDLGYETVSANDADDALSILRSSPHIAALFTDVYLKVEVHGGCDLANQAIRLQPHLRILYTTGNSVTVEMTALFPKDARLLPKPYTQRQLQDALSLLLAA